MEKSEILRRYRKSNAFIKYFHDDDTLYVIFDINQRDRIKDYEPCGAEIVWFISENDEPIGINVWPASKILQLKLQNYLETYTKNLEEICEVYNYKIPSEISIDKVREISSMIINKVLNYIKEGVNENCITVYISPPWSERYYISWHINLYNNISLEFQYFSVKGECNCDETNRYPCISLFPQGELYILSKYLQSTLKIASGVDEFHYYLNESIKDISNLMKKIPEEQMPLSYLKREIEYSIRRKVPYYIILSYLKRDLVRGLLAPPLYSSLASLIETMRRLNEISRIIVGDLRGLYIYTLGYLLRRRES